MSEAEIDDELTHFTRRFSGESAYLASLGELGWSEKEMRYRIAARIQQEKYLENMIEIEVRKVGGDTTLGKVKELILAAEQTKLPIMKIVDRYARFYTPTILMLAIVVCIDNPLRLPALDEVGNAVPIRIHEQGIGGRGVAFMEVVGIDLVPIG